MHKLLIVLLLSTHLLITPACDAIYGPEDDTAIIVTPPGTYTSTVEPGSSYTFTFAAIVEDPFAKLTKKAFIIKADDLKASITTAWKKYFNLLASYGIHSSAGVITQYFENVTTSQTDEHLALIESGVEYWHHGWDHQLDADVAEFQGTSYDHQYTHLRDGIDIIKDKLDYIIHSFGAPGNRWDTTTVAALVNIPEIKVWMYGSDIAGKMNLPIRWLMEGGGNVYDIETMKSILNTSVDWPALMFQIHPNSWNDDNYNQFEINMEYLLSLEDYVFMTPYEYFKIDSDRENIIVTQLDSLTYKVDLTTATYSHTFEFDTTFTVVSP